MIPAGELRARPSGHTSVTAVSRPHRFLPTSLHRERVSASRHRFLLRRRTRPPCAVSGGFGLHRRLSLDLPASLETQNWEPRKVAFPRSVPKRRGLAGRANCASQYL